MPNPLRAHAIYAYILQCREQDETPPTLREIQVACNLSLSAVVRHVEWLQIQGYISRDHTSRSIRLLKPLPTDEDQVYNGLVHAIRVNSLSPSLKSLRHLCGFSLARVKAALSTLEQQGRVQPDPDDPHLFYPVETHP